MGTSPFPVLVEGSFLPPTEGPRGGFDGLRPRRPSDPFSLTREVEPVRDPDSSRPKFIILSIDGRKSNLRLWGLKLPGGVPPPGTSEAEKPRLGGVGDVDWSAPPGLTAPNGVWEDFSLPRRGAGMTVGSLAIGAKACGAPNDLGNSPGRRPPTPKFPIPVPRRALCPPDVGGAPPPPGGGTPPTEGPFKRSGGFASPTLPPIKVEKSCNSSRIPFSQKDRTLRR